MYQYKREVHNITKDHHYRGNYTCEFCKKDFVNISYQMFCNHVKHRCELNPNMTKIIIKKILPNLSMERAYFNSGKIKKESLLFYLLNKLPPLSIKNDT